MGEAERSFTRCRRVRTFDDKFFRGSLTSVGRFPVEYIRTYLSQEEFDSLPEESRVEAVRCTVSFDQLDFPDKLRASHRKLPTVSGRRAEGLNLLKSSSNFLVKRNRKGKFSKKEVEEPGESDKWFKVYEANKGSVTELHLYAGQLPQPEELDQFLDKFKISGRLDKPCLEYEYKPKDGMLKKVVKEEHEVFDVNGGITTARDEVSTEGSGAVMRGEELQVTPAGREGVPAVGEGVTSGRDGVSAVGEGVNTRREAVTAGRHWVNAVGKGINARREPVTAGIHGVTPAGEGVSAGRDEISAIGEVVKERGEVVIAEINGVTALGEGVNARREAITAGRDEVTARGEGLKERGEAVTAEINGVTALGEGVNARREAITAGRDEVTARGEGLKERGEAVTAEINGVTALGEGVNARREAITAGRDEVTARGEGLKERGEAVTAEINGVTALGEGVNARREAITAGRDEVTARGEGLKERGEAVTAEINGVTALGEGVNSRREAITAGRDEVTARGEGLKERGEAVTAEINGVTALGEGVNSRKEAITAGRHEVTPTGEGASTGRDEAMAKGEGVNARRDEVTARGEGLKERGEAVTAEINGVTALGEGVNARKEAITAGRHGVAPTGEGASTGRDEAMAKGEGVNARREAVTAGEEEVIGGRDGVIEGEEGVLLGLERLTEGREGVTARRERVKKTEEGWQEIRKKERKDRQADRVEANQTKNDDVPSTWQEVKRSKYLHGRCRGRGWEEKSVLKREYSYDDAVFHSWTKQYNRPRNIRPVNNHNLTELGPVARNHIDKRRGDLDRNMQDLFCRQRIFNEAPRRSVHPNNPPFWFNRSINNLIPYQGPRRNKNTFNYPNTRNDFFPGFKNTKGTTRPSSGLESYFISQDKEFTRNSGTTVSDVQEFSLKSEQGEQSITKNLGAEDKKVSSSAQCSYNSSVMVEGNSSCDVIPVLSVKETPQTIENTTSCSIPYTYDGLVEKAQGGGSSDHFGSQKSLHFGFVVLEETSRDRSFPLVSAVWKVTTEMVIVFPDLSVEKATDPAKRK